MYYNLQKKKKFIVYHRNLIWTIFIYFVSKLNLILSDPLFSILFADETTVLSAYIIVISTSTIVIKQKAILAI